MPNYTLFQTRVQIRVQRKKPFLLFTPDSGCFGQYFGLIRFSDYLIGHKEQTPGSQTHDSGQIHLEMNHTQDPLPELAPLEVQAYLLPGYCPKVTSEFAILRKNVLHDL
jgi:hypothetical protein